MLWSGRHLDTTSGFESGCRAEFVLNGISAFIPRLSSMLSTGPRLDSGGADDQDAAMNPQLPFSVELLVDLPVDFATRSASSWSATG
jgi:hypothetical protein